MMGYQNSTLNRDRNGQVAEISYKKILFEWRTVGVTPCMGFHGILYYGFPRRREARLRPRG